MGFPTRVQLIHRQASQQWYVNFPSALAQALQFSKGEVVEWIIEDRAQIVLRRLRPPESALKKTALRSSPNSTASGSSVPPVSRNPGSPSAPKPSR